MINEISQSQEDKYYVTFFNKVSSSQTHKYKKLE